MVTCALCIKLGGKVVVDFLLVINVFTISYGCRTTTTSGKSIEVVVFDAFESVSFGIGQFFQILHLKQRPHQPLLVSENCSFVLRQCTRLTDAPIERRA